jgi:aryl-alcohol dehydrogenase-like predicted oxidoreductase
LFNPENYKEVLKLIEVLKEIGKKYEKTPSQVALNWLINYSDVVVPIPGAKNENQVMENANASGWKMEYKDWYELDRISRSLNISYVTW